MVVVILAAGLGSRYGGLKQLDSVGTNHETIIDFSIYDAIVAGFKKVVFVVRKDFIQQIKEMYLPRLKDKIKVEFVFQELEDIPDEFKNNKRVKPWGTAHALLVAKNAVKDCFCVLNADDFYGKEAFLEMASFLKEIKTTSFEFSMIGYQIKNTLSKNGTVSRGECIINDNFYLEQIQERTAITKKDKNIVYQKNGKDVLLDKNSMVSMNFWGFTPQIFNEIEIQFYEFLKKNYQTEKEEFYLPIVVNNLLKNKKATVKVLKTNAKWMGVTYKKDKENVVLRLAKLQENGIYPKNLWN